MPCGGDLAGAGTPPPGVLLVQSTFGKGLRSGLRTQRWTWFRLRAEWAGPSVVGWAKYHAARRRGGRNVYPLPHADGLALGGVAGGCGDGSGAAGDRGADAADGVE